MRSELKNRVAKISKIRMTWIFGSFFFCMICVCLLCPAFLIFRCFCEIFCAGPAFVIWLYKDCSLCSVVREPKWFFQHENEKIRSTLESFSDFVTPAAACVQEFDGFSLWRQHLKSWPRVQKVLQHCKQNRIYHCENQMSFKGMSLTNILLKQKINMTIFTS